MVADCGFSNLYELIKGGYDNYHIGFLIHGVNLAMKTIYGYDMKETDPMGALSGNEIPVCFIHGKEDSFIPKQNSERMSEANESYDELHIIEKAEHAAFKEVLGTEEYTGRVKGFLAKISG